MPERPHELVHEAVLARHASPAVTVELLWLGEGHYGEFDANDPEDTPLARFDAELRNADGDWRHLTSWCTSLDARSPQHLLDAAARHIHARLTDAVLLDSVKRTASELAHLHADEPCLQEPRRPKHNTITVTVDAVSGRFLSSAALVSVCDSTGATRTSLDSGRTPLEAITHAFGALLPDETATYARQAAAAGGAS